MTCGKTWQPAGTPLLERNDRVAHPAQRYGPSIVSGGHYSPDPAAWAAAGATWWIESWWTIERGPAGLAEVRRRIEAGPPS